LNLQRLEDRQKIPFFKEIDLNKTGNTFTDRSILALKVRKVGRTLTIQSSRIPNHPQWIGDIAK